MTQTPIDLVVCDDGSTDSTVRDLRSLGETVIAAPNRGIARNKNRGIWHLMNRTKADVILLLDDDVIPTRGGWERVWIEAAQRWGHVNYAFPLYRGHTESGEGDPANPGITPMVCGCGLAFRRDVLASIGYMDPRFGRYGHEHSDLSFRSGRAGYGSFTSNDGRTLFYVIDGGLTPCEAQSSGSGDDMERNGKLLIELGKDQIYRHAWRDDAERAEFLAEVAMI